MYPTSIKRFETALQIYLKLAGDLDEDDLINELDYVETLVQLGHVHYTVSLSCRCYIKEAYIHELSVRQILLIRLLGAILKFFVQIS